MSELIGRTVARCLRVTNLVGSASPDEMPESMTSEIQVRLQKIMQTLRRFDKTASLKTRTGREAAQDIDEAAENLEKDLKSGDPSTILKSLSILEQRVDSLQKSIERLKRMVT